MALLARKTEGWGRVILVFGMQIRNFVADSQNSMVDRRSMGFVFPTRLSKEIMDLPQCVKRECIHAWHRDQKNTKKLKNSAVICKTFVNESSFRLEFAKSYRMPCQCWLSRFWIFVDKVEFMDVVLRTLVLK
ncbi:hypothetical protein KSS87_022988 [Heliosperma pusillum]|nr:hypothetical protein KSS87_022988 [Heliosperma pusillum]